MRNTSIESLSKELSITIDEIEEWEEHTEKISKKSLSSLSYFLGCSSVDLLNLCRKNFIFKIQTSVYNVFAHEEYEDGWWGHLGLCPKGEKYSKWFPITLDTANRVSNLLSTADSKNTWIEVETLNNRTLLFNPFTINRVWLLDEGADQPSDDWHIETEDYDPMPSEFYNGLEKYYWDSIDMSDDESISDYVMKEVELYTEINDLGIEQIRKLIIETQIYTIDGEKFSREVTDCRLSEILFYTEGLDEKKILNFGGDEYDLYIPLTQVSVISMPKNLIDNYNEKERLEYED